MKKLFICFLTVILLFSLAACGDTASPAVSESSNLDEKIDAAEDALDDLSDALEDMKDSTEQPDETQAPATEVPPEETPAPENKDTASDEMRPEFVEAMDSYEAYVDEYIEFLELYEQNPSDLKLLAQYAEMLAKMEQFEKDFDAWEDSDLNDAEMTYYTEVQLRVTQKLLEASK